MAPCRRSQPQGRRPTTARPLTGLYRTTAGQELVEAVPRHTIRGAGHLKADTGGFINTAFDKNAERSTAARGSCGPLAERRAYTASTDGGDRFRLWARRRSRCITPARACDAAERTTLPREATRTTTARSISAQEAHSLVDITPFPTGIWQTIDVHPSDRDSGANRLVTHAFSSDAAPLDKQIGGSWVTGTKDVRLALGHEPDHRNASDSRRMPPTSSGSLRMAAWDTAPILESGQSDHAQAGRGSRTCA